MPSPNVFVETIDLEKLITSGTLVFVSKSTDVSKTTAHYHQKCYIIADFDPGTEKIDVSALVKKEKDVFNSKDDEVILRLTGEETKIKSIENSGRRTYLRVEGDFSLPSDLKIQGQNSINIVGNKGNNTLGGSDGKDNIYGGIGDDVLRGGAGDDTLHGGMKYNLSYRRTDNDKLEGGAGDDELFGGAGNDKLYGGAGDDTLHGGRGDDLLDGGPGNDTFYGGSGNNVYNFLAFGDIGYDVVHLDPLGGDEKILFSSGKKYFARWDDKKQEAQFYILDDDVNTYNGKNHIIVKGLSKARKLFITDVYNSSISLEIHKVNCRVGKWRAKYTFYTLLPKGTKEVFLPAHCKLTGLYGPDGKFIHGASKKVKPFVDSTGEINSLFGVQ